MLHLLFLQMKINKKGTIKIEEVSQEHSGEYTCIATNSHGSINFTYNLDVVSEFCSCNLRRQRRRILQRLWYQSYLLDFYCCCFILLPARFPHKPVFEQVPLNLTVEVGERATFTCKVLSDSQPHLQWLRHYQVNGSYVNTDDVPYITVLVSELWKEETTVVGILCAKPVCYILCNGISPGLTANSGPGNPGSGECDIRRGWLVHLPGGQRPGHWTPQCLAECCGTCQWYGQLTHLTSWTVVCCQSVRQLYVVDCLQSEETRSFQYRVSLFLFYHFSFQKHTCSCNCLPSLSAMTPGVMTTTPSSWSQSAWAPPASSSSCSLPSSCSGASSRESIMNHSLHTKNGSSCWGTTFCTQNMGTVHKTPRCRWYLMSGLKAAAALCQATRCRSMRYH